jgi:hypothetical protein
MRSESSFFLKTLDSLQEVPQADGLCNGEEYKKLCFQAQLSKLAFFRQSLLDQALQEFGIRESAVHQFSAQFPEFTLVDSNKLTETMECLKECRQMLINARIEYYKLLLKQEALIHDINAHCAISIDSKIIDYAANLMDALNAKLKTLCLVSKEAFGINCSDLNAHKERLLEQIQAKKDHLSKFYAKREEFEGLARRYGQLVRQIQQKKTDISRFKS